MKKLMIAVAAVACATVGLADDITSANTVGYTGKDVEQAKFVLLSAQFDQVGGGRGINDLMTGLVGVDYDKKGAFKNTAPQIQILNAGGTYDYYYYLNDAWYDDGSKKGATKEGWADMKGNLVTAEFPEGAGFWLKSPSEAATPNVSGEVSNDASADVDCGTTFQLVANTYPIAITLNSDAMTSDDIVGVDYDKKGAFKSTATQIQVLNEGGTYDYYYYLNDAWYDDGSKKGATKEGWADMKGNLVSGTIPVMAGFWTKGTSGAFTLTFKGISK